jgi:hypothetical protein
MAKDPIPVPKPDVVRPPTPSEAPAPDVVNIPEPAPEVERSPPPSTIPQDTPQEIPQNQGLDAMLYPYWASEPAHLSKKNLLDAVSGSPIGNRDLPYLANSRYFLIVLRSSAPASCRSSFTK